jgi:septation ring formation regulator EzrA
MEVFIMSDIWKAIEALRLAKSRLLKAEAEAKRATILERIGLVERYWKDAAGLLWSKFRDDVNEITEALSEVKACVATEEFSLDTLQEKVNKLCNIATEFLNSEEVRKYINETLEGVREEDLPARFAVGAWCVEEFKSQLEALCSEVQGSARTTEGASAAKFRLFKAEVYRR